MEVNTYRGDALELFVSLLQLLVFFIKFLILQIEFGDELVNIVDEFHALAALTEVVTLDVLQNAHAITCPQVSIESVSGETARAKAVHAHVFLVFVFVADVRIVLLLRGFCLAHHAGRHVLFLGDGGNGS